MTDRNPHLRICVAKAALLLCAGLPVHAQSSFNTLGDTNSIAATTTLPDAPSSVAKSIAVKNETSSSLESNEVQGSAVEEPKNLSLIWSPHGLRSENSVWKPMSVGAKFQRFVGSSYSSATLAAAAFSAQNPTMLGWTNERSWNVGQRYAAAYADTRSNAFFEEFLIPSLTHQDPVYHRDAVGNVRGRASYAMSRVFIARKDNGGSTFNTSSVAGAFIASEVNNAFHPYENFSASRTMNRALGHLATRAGMNVVREFWPDFRQRFHGRLGKMMEAYKP